MEHKKEHIKSKFLLVGEVCCDFGCCDLEIQISGNDLKEFSTKRYKSYKKLVFNKQTLMVQILN